MAPEYPYPMPDSNSRPATSRPTGTPHRVALSIAGSDPSGGAGIQADLKTFTAAGVYGGAAITCLTAQNSLGVDSILPVAPEFVRRQIELVLADLPVSHIKTGMLGSDEIAGSVADALRDFPGELICDPVLTASDGHSLFAGETDRPGLTALLSQATVLTPNLAELAALSGKNLSSPAQALAAGERLFARNPGLRALIITGGHLKRGAKEVEDFLLLRHQGAVKVTSVSHQRLETRNTHGTGCTFAAAFTAYHLLLADYEKAFAKATVLMDRLLRGSAGLDLGKGRGGLAHHL